MRVTDPNGKTTNQDVRESTERAKIANQWYSKAKQSYNRFNLSGSFFTPTYTE